MTYGDFKYIRAYIRQRNYERWQMIKDKLRRIFRKRKAINRDMLRMASEFWHEVGYYGEKEI